MRIFVAGLGTETNTFSPIPTALDQFREFGLIRPGEHPDHPLEYTAPLWIARERARTSGWDVVEGTGAFALPAGITTRTTYEMLRDEILDQLRDALPVEAVALSMHGAMVADGYPDCEGDMLQCIRAIVGEQVAIGLELDPHCHLTGAMTQSADVIIAFKEYPHTDFLRAARELLDILESRVNRRSNPVMSVYDCHMISIYHTTSEPMKSFVRRLRELESESDILSISIAHGFPWGDVAEIGTKVLVITDGNPVRGETLARELGQELFTLRGKTFNLPMTLEQGVACAIATPMGPVVVSDTSDNPGGGAPGDSTFVMRELLDKRVKNACLGPLWDPMSVQTAFSAGVGASLDMRIGGKSGSSSGWPLDVHATVTALCPDSRQAFAESRVKLGDCAAIRVDGIDIVLSSLRSQALGLDLFTNLGINPANYQVVVVKSSHHFHHAFAGIAKSIIYVDSPGALAQDFTRINYTQLERPMWPMVDDPFTV